MSALRNHAYMKDLESLFGGVGRRGSLTDAQLLERFVSVGDQASFEALVTRHGPMILATCRGVLRDAHAAEDALQATLLVLARKASSLRVDGSLGGWLHRVAFRIALQADEAAARRRRREREAGAAAARRCAGAPDDDLRRLVHEALDRLPDALRLPVVLCDLQGLTQDVAALQLGMSEGTFRRRLARARERLRTRLGRSLGSASAGLLASLLAPEPAAAAQVCDAARAAVNGTTSARAAAWAATAGAAGRAARGGVLAAALLALCPIAAALIVWASWAPDDAPPPASAVTAPPQAPRAEPEAPLAPKGRRLYVSGVSWLPGVPPDDRWRTFVVDAERGDARRAASVDVRSAIYRDAEGEVVAWSPEGVPDGSLWVRDGEGRAERLVDLRGREADCAGVGLVRSPDGRRLIATTTESRDGRTATTNWRMNSDGTERAPLPLQVTDRVADWSPDGTTLLIVANLDPPPGASAAASELLLTDPDGGRVRRLVGARDVFEARFAPDGSRIAFLGRSTDGPFGLWIVNADGSGLRAVLTPQRSPTGGFCWSPDGTRLAWGSLSDPRTTPGPQRVIVEVVGADGSGRREVKLPVGFTALSELTWR